MSTDWSIPHVVLSPVPVLAGDNTYRPDALTESDETWRSIVELMDEGVVLVAPNGTVRYSNPEAAHLLRVSSDTIRGTPVLDYLGAEPSHEHPSVGNLGTTSGRRRRDGHVLNVRAFVSQSSNSVTATLLILTDNHTGPGTPLRLVDDHEEKETGAVVPSRVAAEPGEAIRIPAGRETRLFNHLRNGNPARLSLICARPGWGVETMLNSWASTYFHGRTIWYRVNETDDDDIAFSRHLAGAVGALARNTPSSLADDAESVLAELVNSLRAKPHEPLLLVINDQQSVDIATTSFRANLISHHLSDDMHVVMALPPNGTTYVSNSEQTNLMRQSDLGLQPDEIVSVLSEQFNTHITALQAMSLHKVTGGFPPAIAFVGQHMDGNSSNFPQCLSLLSSDVPVFDDESGEATPGRDKQSSKVTNMLWLEPLTEAELVVLNNMQRMLTYREIAASLVVSINTVKTHVSAIFRKLGVTKRRDAISVAKAHQLI